MALRVIDSREDPQTSYPDVDIYLHKNTDGSVDVVSEWGSTQEPAHVHLIRFHPSGRVHALESVGNFWNRKDGKIVVE